MSSENAGSSTGVRDNVLGLIDFLSAYDARRNPPVRDITDFRMFRLREDALPEHPAINLAATADAWLTVDFIDLPAAPFVPEDLRPLLVSGLPLSMNGAPVVAADWPEELSVSPGETGDVRATSVDEEKRRAALLAEAAAWVQTTWLPWSEESKLASAVKSLHRQLFEQRELLLLERESVELMWGFGRGRWLNDGYTIDHPLLTFPVEIDLDAKTQQIRVRRVGSHDIESAYLLGLDLHDRTSLAAARTASVELDLDPWSGTEASELIARLARFIDDEGVVVDVAEPCARFRADLSWTIFMRRKVPDSQGFLEQMRRTYLDSDGHIPMALRDIVDNSPGTPGHAEDENSGMAPRATSLDPLLLPLATNEQQQRILRSAQSHPGVTVQGPPGTGKSHTIANLISHYVAYGQRVLVVAEKEQALRVLADKIPEGIRDLTVSILGADEESRKRLEKSISTIQSHVSTLDKRVADQDIARLRQELDEIDRGIGQTTREMFEARQLETIALEGSWAAGNDPTPQQAGEWLRKNAGQFSHIDDAIPPATPFPLGSGELQEMVDLLGRIGLTTAIEALRPLPEPGDLPTPSELEELLRHKASGQDSANAVKSSFRNWEAFVAADPAAVDALASDLESAASLLVEVEGSPYGPVLQHAFDPLRAREWAHYLERLVEFREHAYAFRAPLLTHDVALPDLLEPTVLQRLEDAREVLEAKGKLGLFDRAAKRTMEQFSVDGRTPSTVDDVSLCIAAASLEGVRGHIQALWRNQSPMRTNALSQRPEDDVSAEISMFERIQSYPGLAAVLNDRLSAIGHGGIRQACSTELVDTASQLRSANRWHEAAQSAATIERLRTSLAAGVADPDASRIHEQLSRDLAAQDLAAWTEHRKTVLGLRDIRPAARRLLDLRSTLEVTAPEWTARIVDDPSAAGNPRDAGQAWEFRQLETWLRLVSERADPGQLQSRIDRFSDLRRKTVAALVSEMAWRRLSDNLGPVERQALQGYMQATKKYGKTGGKFAQRWIAEMRRSLDESSSAVPAWIMTTSRALTSFQPDRTPPFDVLIVDEASQIGFEALPLLSLSKTTIVVGDDKQTSPENVGLQREEVFDLMDDYLSRLPNYRILFDPDNSLYDLAVQKFATPIMLTEHFRCLPEIIAFSNQHAYNGLITPLRDRPPVPGWAPLGLVKVRDGYRQGDINEPEGHQVVKLISDLCADPTYKGMTFGVVSLLGSSQSKWIWDRLYDRLGPEEMEARRIRCGEAANFQGDERDVIVISTVVAVDPSLPNKRLGAMTSVRDLRRINVTTSRAKNQMWVVTSVDPDQLPNGDLRAQLIRHCLSAGITENKNEDLFEACDSEFEVRVVRDLLNRGYEGVTVQHNVGKYRLDIVVSGPDGRLAIECDGERWHGPDVWHRDRARQEVLERAGWTFQRIRGSAYFRDPEAAMEPVWERLESLRIPTGKEWMTSPRGPIVLEVSGEDTSADGDSDFQLWTSELTSPESSDLPEEVGEPGASRAEVGGRDEPEAQEIPAHVLPRVTEDAESAAARARTAGALQSNEVVQVEADRDGSPGAGPETRGPAAIPRGRGLADLAPYVGWNGHDLPSPAASNSASIQLGLGAIVAAEGPMIARRAYLLYVQASGGQRVGRETRRLFNQAVSRMLASERLRRVDDGVAGLVEATLYAAGQPQVELRELGPRTIFDVPLSELKTLIGELSAAGVSKADLPREVLSCYGLRKLTQKTHTHIVNCLDYSWTKSDD